MVRFLSKKNLLFLVSFQAPFPDESDNYKWPEAYTSDIRDLIGILRQCPSYQLDRNHRHCGFRSQLLPALDFITTCIEVGLGIKIIHEKGPKPDSNFDSWKPSPVDPKFKSVWVIADGKKIDCASDKPTEEFHFSLHKSKMAWGIGQAGVKELFTAKSWNWATEPDIDIGRLGNSFGAIK